MTYLMERAAKRVRRNKKKYALIVLQTVLGVCMISLSLNLTLGFHKQLGSFQNQLNRPYVAVTTKQNFSADKSEITLEDWENIKKQFAQEKGMSFYKQYAFSEGCKGNISFLFVDGSFYKNIMGMKNVPARESVFIGKNAKQKLAETHEIDDQKAAKYFDSKDGTLFHWPIASFVPLETTGYDVEGLLSDTRYSDQSIHAGPFDDFIIFPLSAAQELPCNSYVAILIGSKDDTAISKQAVAIQNYLMTQHTGQRYTVRNYTAEVETTLGRNVHVSEMLNFLACFVLVIVTFSLVGLLLVLLNQRKVEFAISFMCGATYRQILMEVFDEIALVVIGSTVLGNLLSIPILPMFAGSFVQVGYHVSTLAICVGGALLLCVIVCGIALHRIRLVSPVKSLKNL